VGVKSAALHVKHADMLVLNTEHASMLVLNTEHACVFTA
jgi:hypothetical protein